MTLAEKYNILSRLGTILDLLGKNQEWPGYTLGINKEEYDSLNGLVQSVHHYNAWFKETEVRKSFLAISKWLKPEELEKWTSTYKLKDESGKRVAIIMAGNIPLVGFHDFVSVFIAGHKAVVKLSSDDNKLFPALLNVMTLFNQDILNWVRVEENKVENFDAVIATGSNNTSRYFESYFGKYPNIIRKNRTSIAVLDGSESVEDLKLLGKDIFDYFGLGCRNVSQIWIPEDYEIKQFFEAIYEFNDIINHNKYANNYDYNKAVFLLNLEVLLDNGFLLLKENASLHSPLAVIHYQRYSDPKEFSDFVNSNEEQIQVVIGHGYTPFGRSQEPELSDYADGVDTLAFLSKL